MHAVRDSALLPGPALIRDSEWVGFFLPFVLRMMFVADRLLLLSWSTWLRSWALCTGQLLVLTWV